MRTPSSVLLAALLMSSATMPEAQASQDLGKVMFVGDSITHGFTTASYRWELHKIFVDNGVSFSVVGVTQHNRIPETGVVAGTSYAGVPFNNRHSSMSGERAYEIAGRINDSKRLGHSNIFDWLGLDQTYTGSFRIDPATEMPDTFIMLIGTNDTYSDYGRRGGIAQRENYDTVRHNMFREGGDMDTIVDAMRTANPSARIVLLAMPTWHENTPHSNTPEDYVALAAFNQELQAWAAKRQLPLVPVNRGLADVTRADKPGMGEDQFFNAQDHLHPTPQGDRLIAAEVAKTLGVGGRTAGLPRKATAELPVATSSTDAAAACGLTCVLPAPRVGNGAEEGWNTTDALQLRVSHATHTGTLSVAEHAILWNGTTKLYSADMSANTDDLRVAWVAGDEAANRPQGFYVWLGDRLIGEALPCTVGTPAAPVLTKPATVPSQCGELRVAPASYAPGL